MYIPQPPDKYDMDRRLRPRTRMQFEAKVTNQNKREQSALGRVYDMSDSGISVILPLRLDSEDIVELEMADSLLVGRVVYCNPEDGVYRLGIEIQRAQLGDSGLANLLHRTLMEAMPSVPGVEQGETYIG
jgi:PilZ domain